MIRNQIDQDLDPRPLADATSSSRSSRLPYSGAPSSSRPRHSPNRHWGRGDRAQPDSVHAEPRQMVEPVDDTAQISDAVAVAVGERAHVDLIEQPVCHQGPEGRGSAATGDDSDTSSPWICMLSSCSIGHRSTTRSIGGRPAPPSRRSALRSIVMVSIAPFDAS